MKPKPLSTKKQKKRLYLTVSVLFICTIPWAVLAKDIEKATELDSITVTANKMEESIQDVPQSITVIDGEILKEKGIENIPDVINEIPNMDYKFGGSIGSVNFRGLNQSFYTSNNPVVIYIDGVAYSNAYGFDASLVNAERIEVLRGPQGTLYGKDAIGAVIKVVTKEPENEWHGNVGAEYGNYNYIQGSFNVNGPLIQDTLYLGLNGRYQQDDGWITNDYTGNDEANKGNRHNLGGYLLYKPSDRFSVKLTLSNDCTEDYWINGYALPSGTDDSEFSRDDAENVFFDEDTVTEIESLAQSIHLKYEFDPVTLTSTTTHRRLKFDAIYDIDYLADTNYDGLVMYNVLESETWAEELRLSSNNTEGVRWIAGVYFDTDDLDKGPLGMELPDSGSVYEMKFESETESKTIAIFGQTMIPFLDSFELTLGARYQRIDKKMNLDMYYNLFGVNSDPIYSLQADETWEVFLPKVALSYRLNDSWNTYASMARGYTPGGFNFSASSGSEEDNTFDPEQSTNYEIGVKGELNRTRFAAAIFYMDIKDIHISKYENGIFTTGNAGGAHSLGAELELVYFLTDSIELTTAVGIIDSEYDNYDDGTLVYDGESISNTPSHTVRIGIAYLHPNGFYTRGDVSNVGDVPYYDSAREEFGERGSYTVADIKAGYRFKNYDIYAYCNNLSDEEYTIDFGGGFSKTALYGDPRTFGVGVRYSF